MTYQSLKTLSKAVKDNLPKHAQEIYLAAFNNAWEEYKNPEMRNDQVSREETAYKVA